MGLIENSNLSDLSKGLAEWALAAGRFYQSSQTGYVHLYNGETKQDAHTIPIFENFLFALALFRSRLVEQIQEAKELIKKLLIFQNQLIDHPGNFPVYLHEYPICHHPALGLQLLAPMYWILKQFGHILGNELKQNLEYAARLSLMHSLNAHQIKSYGLSVRLYAAQLAYGQLWNESKWVQQATEQLETLIIHQLTNWSTTKHLSDLLVGLQMIYPSIKNSAWQPLWQTMENTWHHHLACYMGPCIREWQKAEEPQVNLYDLFGCFFSGQFSRRAALLGPYHLHGILIQPSYDRFEKNDLTYSANGKLKQQDWYIAHYPYSAYTLLEKKESSLDKTHCFFRWIWGDVNRLHSFVCQGGNAEIIEYEKTDHSIVLIFHLKESSLEEDHHLKREIEFFVDVQSDMQFHLNGCLVNTFEMNQTVQLTFKTHQLSMKYELIEGAGDFLGHMMKGNRPSQLDKRSQAYDWTFFLRTIRRQSKCTIKVTLNLLEHFNHE